MLDAECLQDVVKELGLTSVSFDERSTAPERNQKSPVEQQSTAADAGETDAATRIRYTRLFQKKPLVMPIQRRWR